MGDCEAVMKALTEETGVKGDEPAAAEGEMMEGEMMEGGDDMMEGDGMALPEAEPAWDPYEGDGGSYDGMGNLPSMLLRITAKNEYVGDLMKAQVLKWEFNFDDKPDAMEYAKAAGMMSAAVAGAEEKGDSKECFFAGCAGEQDWEALQ